MNQAYLLIGGNLGNRAKNLEAARRLIGERIGNIKKKSALYETAAWGLKTQPDFYNQALLVETDLSPRLLMQTILEIETHLGRVREEQYGPRTVDIDILLYNNDIIRHTNLTIPHPRMTQRRFVLAPLAEIAPAVVHPEAGRPISVILEECEDRSAVARIPV